MPGNPLSRGLARHLSPAQAARLARARVGVAGCGGLGSNVAALLARSGVGAFTLADDDRVEASNLNRQHYWPEDLGRLKAEALAAHLRRIHPAVEALALPCRVTAANAQEVFGLAAEGGGGPRPRCGIVVEALDGAEGKAMLLDAVGGRADLLVAASGIGGWGGPPMARRALGPGVVVVGDFRSETGPGAPPMAPRVMMAAALQADCVLDFLLGNPEAPVAHPNP